MKKIEFNSDRQKKNENSDMFNLAVERKIEVLNLYEMDQIRGGEGEEEDTHPDWK